MVWTDRDEREYQKIIQEQAAKDCSRRSEARKLKRLKKVWRGKAVWVHFTTEAPRIGSGMRRVYVERIGPKWVKLRAVATGYRATLTRRDWNRLTTG